MRSVLVLTVLATALTAVAQSTAARSKTSVRPSVSAKAGNKTAAGKSGARVTTQRARAGTSRHVVNGRWVSASRASAGPPKPLLQQHPDPDRYQEIQKALQERGYFTGEANGQWNDDSSDALKRFQSAQNLSSDGKISSKTLMGLGLGPKHEGAAITPPVAAAPTPSKPQ